MIRSIFPAIALLCLVRLAFGQPSPALNEQMKLLAPGHWVYVVGVDTSSRDLSLTSTDLVLERTVKEQFRKEKRFRIANSVSQADFVFIVYVDNASRNLEEAAIAVPAESYRQAGGNMDALRNAALWQGDSRLNPMPHVAAAMLTGGLSAWVDRPSVSKNLVKQFHKAL